MNTSVVQYVLSKKLCDAHLYEYMGAYRPATSVKYEHCAVQSGAAAKPTMMDVVTMVAHTA